MPDILRRARRHGVQHAGGTLYPLLSKLRRGIVQYGRVDAGPPRKYYRLTDSADALDEYWNLINRVADFGQ